MRLRSIRFRRPDEGGVGPLRDRLEALARQECEAKRLQELRLILLAEQTAEVQLLGAEAEVLGRVAGVLGEAGLEPESIVEGEVVVVARRAHEDPDEALTDDERRDRFVHEVARSGELWGLYDQTWARSAAAGDAEALPLWARREQAARCIAGPWGSFIPRRIERDAFLEQWLTGMQEDGIMAVLWPTERHPGAVVSAAELAAALTEALG